GTDSRSGGSGRHRSPRGWRSRGYYRAVAQRTDRDRGGDLRDLVAHPEVRVGSVLRRGISDTVWRAEVRGRRGHRTAAREVPGRRLAESAVTGPFLSTARAQCLAVAR